MEVFGKKDEATSGFGHTDNTYYIMNQNQIDCQLGFHLQGIFFRILVHFVLDIKSIKYT